ncbi:MAG: TlpA family protein disulfide reductase [Pirellulales bacterium]
MTITLSALAFQSLRAAEPANSKAADDGTADVVVSDNEFKVPEGDATKLLAFVEKIANPQQQFTSEVELQQYLDGVSTAISEATDKVLAGQATDRQLIDAIEWKIESLRIRQKLGETDSDKKTDEFLASLKFDSRPAVQDAIKQIEANRAAMQQQMELMAKLRQWPRLDAAQRQETTDWLINAIKSGPPSGAQAGMLTMFVDTLSGTPDSALAKKALGELLPVFSASDDPSIQQRLPLLEGINRRLNLVGNKMELEGTFLDGTKLDWAAYEGKVVLVDFWATWCGPCRAEVPNVLENYLKYHDKGFDVIGISLDDKRSDAEDYVKQTNIPWASLFEENTGETGWQNPMALKYGITGIPTAILIDQKGNVVSLQARGPRLGALLEKLLGKTGEEAAAVEVSDQSEHTAQTAR